MTELSPAALQQIEYAIERAVQKALKKADSKWVDKDTAMALLGCQRTKLNRLVAEGHIRKTGGNGRKSIKMYHRGDIEHYLDNMA